MRCRYTEIAQRIFKFSDTHYISLTPDKELNSLVYRTLLYVKIYGSYKLSKNSPVFWPTLYIWIDAPRGSKTLPDAND